MLILAHPRNCWECLRFAGFTFFLSCTSFALWFRSSLARAFALILLFVQFNIHLVFLNRINYSQKVLTMIYCSNDYYRRFKLHVHTDTQLNRRCFGRRGVKIALITFIYTVTRVSGLKLTLLISLALKECVCFVLFVTVYFTGYGPYPGRYTLLFTLNTVPCRLIA